jgi:hypothetical protein
MMSSKEDPLIITDDDGNVVAMFTSPVSFGGGHAVGGDINIQDGDLYIDGASTAVRMVIFSAQ